jgi:hypothetical protein
MTSFFLVFFDPGKRMVISGPGYRRGKSPRTYSAGAVAGSWIKNFAPLPKPSLSARIVPLCISTMASGPALLGFVQCAQSIASAVEIDLVVALPRERKGEARTTKSAPQTPAPGDIAVLKSKARMDAQALAPAKGNRLGRPETPGDRGHQVWDWDILPSHIRKREEVTCSFTGARFHIPRRFAWSQR